MSYVVTPQAEGCTRAMRWSIKTLVFRLIQRALYHSWRGSYEKYCLTTFDAIKICDLASSDEKEQEAFGSRTVKALQLIKEYDSKRYHRVQNHLVYIVNSRILSTGLYNHSLRSCTVRNSAFSSQGDEDWAILMLACTIIHEATHGAMLARKIPYDADYYLRVERICHQEEARFARRVLPEVDLGEYDGNWHQEMFQMGKWEYIVKYVKSAFKPEQSAV